VCLNEVTSPPNLPLIYDKLVFRNQVSVSKVTKLHLQEKTKQLMLFRKLIAAFSESRMKQHVSKSQGT
jgi:hypothetical protein